MSFKVDCFEAKKNQLEIDLQIKPTQPLRTVQLTFEKEHIEQELGIEWDQFVKAAHEVVTEIATKEDARLGLQE